MIDGTVRIVDAEVDAQLSSADLLENPFDVARQGLRQVIPPPHRATHASDQPLRVEPFGHHLLHIGLDQFRDTDVGVHAAAEALQPENDAEQEREIGRQDELVVVQQLHARVHDRDHVEVPDADEEVPVQPRLDVRSQLVHVDRRWWRRHLDDDVDSAVDVVCADGDHHVLELSLPHAREPADVTEVEDARCVPSGSKKFPGCGSA